MITERPFRILVASDGSTAAFSSVHTLTRMAVPKDVEVAIVTVLSQSVRPSAFDGRPQDDAEAVRLVDASVEQAVSAIRDELEAHGFRPCVRHRFGHPADGILDEARDWGADMVVLGRRDLSRPARWLLGSVSEAVTRRSHVPVLVAV